MHSSERTLELTNELQNNSNAPSVSMEYFFLGTQDEEKAVNLGQALSKNTTVTSLNLKHNQLSEKALEHIVTGLHNHPKLRTLNIEHNPLANSGPVLKELLLRNNTLLSLHIGECHITDASMKSICEALKQNNTLTELFAHHNKIGDESAKYLSEALQTNHTLHTLQLERMFRNMELTGPCISWKGMRDFETMFKHNRTLKNFDISHHDEIGTSGALHLASILGDSNCPLVELHLNSTEIGKDGSLAIGEALEKNPNLTTLHMDWNLMGTEAACKFAKMLLVNPRIAHLSLMSNRMSDPGANAFAEVLRRNTTLDQISLTDNEITSHGAQSLLHGIKNNYTCSNIAYHSDDRFPIEERISSGIDQYISRNKVMPLAPRVKVGLWWVPPPVGSRLIRQTTVVPSLVPEVLQQCIWENKIATVLGGGDKIGAAELMVGFAAVCDFFGDKERAEEFRVRAKVLHPAVSMDTEDHGAAETVRAHHGCCDHGHAHNNGNVTVEEY